MSEIQPIDDAYIDSIIKAGDAYNPNLSKTQGIQLRELIKLMRNRFEQQLANCSSGQPSKQTLPDTTRALPFNFSLTTIQAITTMTDIVFTLDQTDAADGSMVSLVILQNHNVEFSADFIEMTGSMPAVLGKMNYYRIVRLNGTHQFTRYQNIADSEDSAGTVVGDTVLTAIALDSTSIALSWTAATNATQYVVRRYSTPNYNEWVDTLYAGSDLSLTDTGLTAGSHYYYVIFPGTTAVSGRAAYADVQTAGNTKNNTKLTGSVFSHGGITYSPDYAAANAFDGSTDNNSGNCFASEENPSEVYIGLDLGSPKLINNVKIYPRDNENGNTELSDRLLNTRIQGSNTSQDTGFIDLFTITNVVPSEFNTYSLANNLAAYRYYRLYKNNWTNLDVAEIEFYGVSTTSNGYTKLTGTAFGTESYSEGSGNTFDKVFDGDLTTFFDAADPSNSYAGLDLGTAQVLRKIKVAPRTTLWERSQGMIIQGSNHSSNEGYVDLFTIPDILPPGVLTEYLINSNIAYRYYRVYSSFQGYCNLAEAEFYTSTNLPNEPDPITTQQQVKINLIGYDHHSGLSDWNDYTLGMSPEFLKNPSGIATGIKFVVDSGPIIPYYIGFDPPATTNFPGEISATVWYQDAGGISTWHFTGLDDSKTYTIITLCFDHEDEGDTSITWGGITQSINTSNNQTELTFSNIYPFSGEIHGVFGGPGLYTVINGIILTENPQPNYL